MRLELGVERKQRVEYHIAVIARDVGGRPDRIEHAQIRLGDKAQGLLIGGPPAPARSEAGAGRPPGRDCEFTTCYSASHPSSPPMGLLSCNLNSKNRTNGRLR